MERAALAAYCTWRFLQRTSPRAEEEEEDDEEDEQEEEVAPCTPVSKPAAAPSGSLSALDLVKVARYCLPLTAYYLLLTTYC